MAASLLELMEELLQSIEQRDAGDPDAPAWEAAGRIRRLEEELARRLGEVGDPRRLAGEASGVAVSTAAQSPGDLDVLPRRPAEALAGIA